MKFNIINDLREIFRIIDPKYIGMFLVYNIKGEDGWACLQLLTSDDKQTFQTESQAYEYIDSRIKEICDLKEPFSGEYANFAASNNIARNSRRGVGEYIYKNYVFYKGANHIPCDSPFLVYNIDNEFVVYANPKVELYFERIV